MSWESTNINDNEWPLVDVDHLGVDTVTSVT